MVNARVMLLPVLLILYALLSATANTHNDKELKRVLNKHGILKMEISSESRAEFNTYMSSYCLTQLSPVDFLSHYIAWEHVEFMDSVRDFLDPTHSDRGDVSNYFHHLPHEFKTNCSVTNDTEARRRYEHVIYDALFDNFMYDMMTRQEWTGVNI